MIDFSTQYLGLKLNGPIVVSSTPISESIDNVRRMEDSGAAAIVLHSLFEEQLALESKALDDDLFARHGFLCKPALRDLGLAARVSRCRTRCSSKLRRSTAGVMQSGSPMPMQERKTWFCDAISLKAASASCSPRSGGQIERAAQPNHRGHRLRHQRIEGGAAHHLKHLPGLLGAWPDVAGRRNASGCLQPAVFRRRLRGGVLRNCLCRIQSVL